MPPFCSIKNTLKRSPTAFKMSGGQCPTSESNIPTPEHYCFCFSSNFFNHLGQTISIHGVISHISHGFSWFLFYIQHFFQTSFPVNMKLSQLCFCSLLIESNSTGQIVSQIIFHFENKSIDFNVPGHPQLTQEGLKSSCCPYIWP